MKARRQILFLLLALVLVAVMPMQAAAAGTGGSCGAGVSWNYDAATGTLTISGEGAMDDYSWLDQPWAGIANDVKCVVVEDGVTHIGDNAFYGCDNAETAIIAASVTDVGTHAFYGHFEAFYFKGNIPATGNLAFFSKVGATAYYPKGNSTWTQDAREEIDEYLEWSTWQPGVDPDPIPSEPDNTCGEDLKWYLDTESGIITITGTGEMTDFPDRSDSPWYHQRDAVTAVVIEEGVTSIGNNAFEQCKNMTKAVIPSSVVSIGSNAFCLTGLTEVTLEEGLLEIGDSAFRFCGFTEIDIPDSVTHIGQRAFEHCGNLTSLVLPEGLTNINHYTFSGCEKLVDISIPESVTAINTGAFDECTSLQEVKLPDGLTSIGEHAFSKCSGLTGTMVIPEGVTSIGDWTFYKCSGLTEIVLPEGLSGIGGQAFRECTALSKIAIPDGVKEIGSEAFLNCKSLSEIEIPEGITKIEVNTFNGCSMLKNVTLPDSVTSIEASAFWYCSGLESLIIPANVTSIGQNAFNGCKAVTSIEFKGDAPLIGNEAFGQIKANAFYPAGNATWTEEILQGYKENAGNNITWYEAGSHVHDYSTEEVTPPTCTEKGYTTYICKCGDSYQDKFVNAKNHRFYGSWYEYKAPTVDEPGEKRRNCDNCDFFQSEVLEKIPVPIDPDKAPPAHTCGKNLTWEFDEETGTLTISGYGEMYDYQESSGQISNPWKSYRKEIKKIILPDGITTIGKRAFQYCIALESIEIPDSVENIRHYAFYYCTALPSIVIPKKVTMLDATFDKCKNLSDVIIEGPLTTITEYTFRDCGLSSITLPETVTELPGAVFWNNQQLTEITIPASVKRLGYDTFAKCANLKTVTFMGDAPKFAYQSCAFNGVTATIYYPGNNDSWTEEIISQSHGGTLTWVPYETEHTHTYTENVTPPTCTEQGFTTFNCDCGESYVDNYVNALGHSWNDGEVTKEPTETEEGIKTYTCTVCEETKTESIPVVPAHKHTYTEAVTAPTCTEQGYTTFTCDCGETYLDNYVDALGHSWNDGEVTKEPTETEEGIKTYTCTVCEETKTESIPVVPAHKHTYTEAVTAPTCTEQGYTTFTCDCGESYVGNYVEANGHVADEWLMDGIWHWHICTVCQETVDVEEHDGVSCSICGYEIPGEPDHEGKLGDVNHDSKINAKDATLILQSSVGVLKDNAKFCETCAEVSGDGKLNAKDSTLILQYSVGLREIFPAAQ